MTKKANKDGKGRTIGTKPFKNAKTKGVRKMKSSLTIQKALAPKVTEKMLEYELYRFCTMTVEQIAMRIGKTRNAVKLEATRQMAKIVGEKKLMRLARAQRNTVYA